MKRLFYILPLFLLIACEKTINYDLPDEGQKLTLASLIASNNLEANIGLTEFILSTKDPDSYVKADSLNVYENNNLIRQISPINFASDSLNPDRFFIYRMSYNFKPGSTYKLEAFKEGYSPVTGRTRIPFPPIVGRASYERTNDKITFTIADEFEGEENFYRIRLYQSSTNGSLIEIPISTFDPVLEIYDFSFVDFFDFEEGERVGAQAFLRDEFFDGSFKEITIYDAFGYSGSQVSPLILEVTALPRDQYRWEITKEISDFTSDNPFSEPVQVHSNIENGFGIVGSETSVQVNLTQ